MNIQAEFTIKKYKTAQSKAYVDITCQVIHSDSGSASGFYDSCIFVMQKLPKNALGESTFRFSHVADPVDLQDYPAEQTQDSPYFRTDKIILRVRNQFQAQQVLNTMRSEIKYLAQALSALPESEEFFSQTFTG